MTHSNLECFDIYTLTSFLHIFIIVRGTGVKPSHCRVKLELTTPSLEVKLALTRCINSLLRVEFNKKKSFRPPSIEVCVLECVILQRVFFCVCLVCVQLLFDEEDDI